MIVKELFVYILMIMVAGALSLSLSFFSYFKLKDAPGARPYMIATFLSAIFTFSYVFELTSNTLAEIQFWLGIEYLVMPFIPVFLLLMSCEYVGIKLKKSYLCFLFTIPIMIVFSQHSNHLHQLFYSSVSLKSDVPFPIVDLQYGPLFYIQALNLLLCLSISIVILLINLNKHSTRFRLQILIMAGGLIVPIIANHFYLNDLSPYGIDLGPVSMGVSFILHGMALLAFQMFHVLPIAKEQVFDSMLEGVIVMNQQRAIVDYNKAILPVIPTLRPSSIGKDIENVLGSNEKLADILRSGEDCDYECSVGTENLYFQVRFSSVTKKNGHKVGEIISFVDITERVILQKELRQLAIYDGLTQIFNRTHFMEESTKQFHSLKSRGGIVAILMFDIDFFKQINDSYGHDVGDDVLLMVANIVRGQIREEDLFARYGGEEFILFLPETDFHVASAIAESIRKSVAEYRFVSKHTAINMSLSIGGTCHILYTGDQSISIKSAIREADIAVYEAKRSGRNNVKFYHKEKQPTYSL